MERLFDAVQDIDILAPPEEYIRGLLKALCNNLGYSFGSVIVDGNGNGRMVTAYNLPEYYSDRVNEIAPPLSSPSGEAIRTGKIVIAQDVFSEPRLAPWHDLLRECSVKMLVWVPLMRKRVSYGVYVLYDRRNRGVSGDEKRILEQIGTMISLAIISNHHHNQQRHAEQLLRDSYEEVSIPVIQAWDSILAIPVIGAVDSRRLDRLMDTMLVRIRDTRSKIVIIDITGSHSLDSNATSHLINIAQAAKLLGATCVITGIKPEIAQTAVRLGLDMELGCLTTRKTLQDGLRYGLQKIGYSIEIRDTT